MQKHRDKLEDKWRSTKLKSDRVFFQKARSNFSCALRDAKTLHYKTEISAASGNQRKMYSIVEKLTKSSNKNIYPPCESFSILADEMGEFYVWKINEIRSHIARESISENQSVRTYDRPKTLLTKFQPVDMDLVDKMITRSKTTGNDILDPIPTSLFKQCKNTLLPTITHIVNLSLISGQFPTQWKHAIVTPLLKKPNIEQIPKNYRPVSNLSFVSKIIERIVIDQLLVHIGASCPLPDCTSAYRPYHSTETALVKVQSDILNAMERQQVTLLVLIDLSAAFDTVDHASLFTILESKYGVTDTALKWFISYLSGRTQSISIEGNLSRIFALEHGVPQGSCLGPLLFTLYASSLFDVIKANNINVHGYADDHQLYVSFSPKTVHSQNSAISCMEKCLCDVKMWMNEFNLRMNDSKTECIIIGTRQQLDKISCSSIRVGKAIVETVSDLRNLGSYFDRTMSMSKHIDQKCKSAFYQIYNISKIRGILDQESCEMLVHSLIFSHVDYCNALLYGVPYTELSKLQRIINSAARLVYRERKHCHITPLLTELHWLPISYRIQFKILLFVFKCLHSTAPKYLCDYISVKQPARSIRIRPGITLEVPRVRRKTLAARSFASAGPTLWNALPYDIQLVDNLDTFKKKLKTHLLKSAFDM